MSFGSSGKSAGSRVGGVRGRLYSDSEQIFETSIDRDTGRPVVDLSALRAKAR